VSGEVEALLVETAARVMVFGKYFCWIFIGYSDSFILYYIIFTESANIKTGSSCLYRNQQWYFWL